MRPYLQYIIIILVLLLYSTYAIDHACTPYAVREQEQEHNILHVCLVTTVKLFEHIATSRSTCKADMICSTLLMHDITDHIHIGCNSYHDHIHIGCNSYHDHIHIGCNSYQSTEPLQRVPKRAQGYEA